MRTRPGDFLSASRDVDELSDGFQNLIVDRAVRGDHARVVLELSAVAEVEIVAADIGDASAGFFDDDDFEFVELHNLGDRPLDLSGVSFTDGIGFVFAEGTTLGAGAYAVVVRNQAAFEARYGTDIAIIGQYGPARLSNGGERVELLDGPHRILAFDYRDDWAAETDGGGKSLVIADAAANRDTWDDAAAWVVSSPLHGSPGAPNISTGGVSVFGLIFAAAAGAKPIITSSRDEKLERAMALGAIGTANYRKNPDWQMKKIDRRTIRTVGMEAAKMMIRTGVGRVRLDDWVLDESDPHFGWGNHHLGGARMSKTPETGVVDANCRVHGTPNLYVAGSAVFPTAGHANPTLTITQFALRLADHLASLT